MFFNRVVSAKGPYETDVRFALTELEAHCGEFFTVKDIKWEERGIESIGVTPHETVTYEAGDLSQGVDSLIARATERLARFPKKKVPYRPEKYDWQPQETAK